MCPECREEVTSKCYCIRCGKEIGKESDIDQFVNPNFNEDEYQAKLNM